MKPGWKRERWEERGGKKPEFKLLFEPKGAEIAEPRRVSERFTTGTVTGDAGCSVRIGEHSIIMVDDKGQVASVTVAGKTVHLGKPSDSTQAQKW